MKIKRIYPDAKLPTYATKGSVGMDVYAHLSSDSIIIEPGQSKLIKTGIAIQLPEGYELQVRSKSGLALKQGLSVLNSPGTIDSDYRGEIAAIIYNNNISLENSNTGSVKIEHGQKIAQLVLSKVDKIDSEWEEVNELDDTERSDGGYGSTGK